MNRSTRLFAPPLLAPMLLAASLASAQEVPPTIPGIANFSLPVITPTPVPTPTPSASPTPVPTATPVAVPSPRPTAAAPATVAPTRERPVPRPTATPAESPQDTPSAALPTVPAASPIPSPTSSISPAGTESAPQPAQSNSIAWLYWLAGLAVLLAAGTVLLLRRRGNQPSASPAAASEPRPAASPPPAATPSAAVPTEAPALDVAFLPSRAGLNLLTALVEGEVMLSNRSDASLDGIQVAAYLLSAHAGQADDVAAVTGAPIVRPVVPVFALQPGESRSVRVVAPLARNAVVPMTAGDRPIFVPLIVVVADHASGRTIQGFAVGIERVDSAKLAPIWLDVPPRMYDTVAARPQALAGQGKSS